MALSEEDRLWIEEKKRKFEREERELKRRGIIPYTEDELEEINAKKEDMREQSELTAEAMKKVGFSSKARFLNREDFIMGSYDYDLRNIARPE